MPDPAQGGPLPSQLLQERYGFGYFHGENSGFSSEGYDRVHATWRHWMPFLREQVGSGARLLDLGCAYGFLVVEALQGGFRAVGADASRFAIAQAERHARPACGRLLAAHAEHLPFADASFDVVTAFDVLEHVPHPERLIAEAARVLRPGGIFAAATPDPLLFDREETTHLAEQVPSWWVRTLEQAGIETALRFFQAPFNCELIGRRSAAPPPVCFDALGESDPVLETAGRPEPLLALRAGFSAPSDDGGRIVSDGALVYLLNRGRTPIEVEIEVRLDAPTSFSVALDGRVVGRFVPGASAEGTGARLVARCLAPAGGHNLRFAVPAGWARLRLLRVSATAATHAALCETLPFDMYERYALAARAAGIVAPDARRLLDIGGTMGGGAGHLAWSGDFFPEHEVRVIDARAADYPEHGVLDPAAPLPFGDREYPLVAALDVLEHVPAADRSAWLAEVWRVTGQVLLLGNPFATPGVADADRYLFELIRTRYGYEHGFLAEHLRHGHPDLEATREFFLARGASVAVLPSGYLPAWVLLQTLNAWLSHPEQDGTYVLANRLANRTVGLGSTAAPAYRHLLVVDRSGKSHEAALAALVGDHPPDLEALSAALAALPSRVQPAGAADGSR